MKPLFFLLILLFPALLFAQPTGRDTAIVKKDSTVLSKDTIPAKIDSGAVVIIDTIAASTPLPNSYNNIIERFLSGSRYLNASGTPVATSTKERPVHFNDVFFYILLALVLILSFFRFFYERYFNNLFRVFFNTSLRQSQLTDQLLQAKQVSLFFNMLFAVSGGLYVYFLLNHFYRIKTAGSIGTLGICTLVIAVIYFLKYLTLKFTGWLTGYREAANTYLFIIFLINKILGILLIPFVVVIAFGASFLQYPAIIISLLLIALMFLLRFLRSYGLLRKDIKVSRAHFFLYIAGIEVIPLLLIYKLLMILLNKNL